MFFRFFPPLAVFCMAAFVWHYNGTHTSSKVMVPFLDLVPALKGNIGAQVDASWKILTGVGVAFLLYAVMDQVRSFRRHREDDAEEGEPSD